MYIIMFYILYLRATPPAAGPPNRQHQGAPRYQPGALRYHLGATSVSITMFLSGRH